MSKEPIEISAELRQDREKSYAVFAGDVTPSGREVLTFLPKSLVEFDGDKTFTMPEWLAKEKGLI